MTAVARPECAAAVRALGAAEVVGSLDAPRGACRLILESVGGASLTAAIGHVETHGTIVVHGNSSGEPMPFLFGGFGSAQNVQMQTFFSFSSETKKAFAPDLTLLARLVADDMLKPHLGGVHGWHDVASGVAGPAARRTMGKAGVPCRLKALAA